MIKFKGQLKGEIEMKRFDLGGLEVMIICPACKNSWVWGRNEYLPHPEMNKHFEIDCYCEKCLHEWQETLFLEVELKAVTP